MSVPNSTVKTTSHISPEVGNLGCLVRLVAHPAGKLGSHGGGDTTTGGNVHHQPSPTAGFSGLV